MIVHSLTHDSGEGAVNSRECKHYRLILTWKVDMVGIFVCQWVSWLTELQSSVHAKGKWNSLTLTMHKVGGTMRALFWLHDNALTHSVLRLYMVEQNARTRSSSEWGYGFTCAYTYFSCLVESNSFLPFAHVAFKSELKPFKLI